MSRSEWRSVLAAAPLDRETQDELFRRIRPPHAPEVRETARETVIRHNTRLASRIAVEVQAKYPWVSLDDLFGYSLQALIGAVDRYKLELGWAFSTYATKRIHYLIKRWALMHEQPVRIPVHVHQQLGNKDMRANPGSPLRDALDLLKKKVFTGEILYTLTSPTVENQNPEVIHAVQTAIEDLERADPMAANILRLRFGLAGPPMSLRTVRDRLGGGSEERIGVIEKAALELLARRLEDYRPPDSPARNSKPIDTYTRHRRSYHHARSYQSR